MHNDDTGMRILRWRASRATNARVSSPAASYRWSGAWTIALFFTGAKHAGENMAEVLKQRARGLPPPIQMCDALSRNTPNGGVEPLLANCSRTEDASLWKWQTTFRRNAVMCWRRWAAFITMTRWRGNRNCRLKSAWLPSGAQRAVDEKLA